MNNKEKLEMIIEGDSAIVWHALEILKTLAVVPEDMMTPETKKIKAAGISFINKYVDILEETVDKTGIKKESKNHNISFYPNGMIDIYGSYHDVGLKPWTPSKKTLEEYEQLKSGHTETITELTAKEQQKKDKLEASRQRRKANLSQGKFNLGAIKRISSIIYWQLRDSSGKKYKFPVNEGKPLAAIIQKMSECSHALEGVDPESQKGAVLSKVCEKYEDQINDCVKIYLGDDSLCAYGYRYWGDDRRKEKYGISCWNMWTNIVPGKEKEFSTLLSSLVAKAFQYNENPKNRWKGKFSITDIMNFIIGKAVAKSMGHLAADSIENDLNAKNEFDEASELLEVSSNVETAIMQNNPNIDGVTPFMRNMLVRMNFCDGEIVKTQEESEQKEEVAV